MNLSPSFRIRRTPGRTISNMLRADGVALMWERYLSKVRMRPLNRLLSSYKDVAVIGERIVTPSSIVYLVAKLRILPPTDSVPEVKDEEENKEKEEEFLMSRKDAEDLVGDNPAGGWAHTPYWPGVSAIVLGYERPFAY
jgi:hypothetical protein